MRGKGFRLLAGSLLLAVLLSLGSAAVGAAGEWEPVGSKVWLDRGDGINLLTGGSGNDLIFDGDTISAPHGIQALSGSKSLDYDLNPPTTGYVTTLETSETVYSRVVVRLADGSLAQVRLGMASFDFMIYTGLFLEEWVVLKGAGIQAPTPAPEPTLDPAPDPTPVARGAAKLRLNNPAAEANGLTKTLDVAPRLIDGQVMLPLRFVADAMGLSLRWNGREQKVSITGEGLSLVLQMEKAEAQLNGRSISLKRAPTVYENRVLFPMDDLGEALAGKVTYDPATGEITLGGSLSSSTPAVVYGSQSVGSDMQTAAWPAHFSGIWLSGYKNGWYSESPDANPDFYLTLNADGSARAILTITTLIAGTGYPYNLEYRGTYTRDPLRVELKLQPPVTSYEPMEYDNPDWQSMTVTGDLSADMSRIDNLSVNGRKARSASATRAKRVPQPGEGR